ncbi:hypothetical protein [Pseudomonas sp. PS01300]|uniref:phage tailspike polysaccharide lyase family protein n=1 Tax=Pseudomonas sp. PS01300 TaxID=2991436 RepID=UPI00249CC6D1|nr:hypothetical protein [Pseudomonas sp. PS01300]
MTVSTTDSIVDFSSGGPDFPIPYRFLQNSDIEAVLTKQDGTTETLTWAQYTLTGAGAQSGGTLTSTYAAGVLAVPGATLTISRVMAAVQPTDLRNQGKFLAETHENVFDRLTMLIQQGLAGLSRALMRPIGKNYYDAEGRQIKNLGDPNDNQDAVNKLWTQQYVGGVVGGIQGPINNSANVLYIYPDGTPHAVQDLSKPDGASGIGWKQRTVADRLNDTANVKDYGAIADGTLHPLSERFATLATAQAVYPHAVALTDSIDWAAYQAAIDSGCPRVHAPGGHYVMNKGTLATRDIAYTGDGYSTRVDFSLASGPGSCMLTQGELTRIGNLGASVVKGARAITFSAAPDLVPGDVIVVYNPTNGSWLIDRDPYRAGEMWKVHSINGNVVTIYGNSSSVYLSSEVQVYRLRGVRVSVNEMHFSPSDTYSIAPFKVLFGDGVKVTNYWASDVTLYTGLEVERCFDVMINMASTPNRSPAVNDEYGLTISNCHNFAVYGGNAAATRHAVAIGGMDDICCVPNRHGLIYGMILDNIDLASDIGAGDMHGNADKITYDNCVFRNGVIMSGRDATVRNSLVYGVSSTDGECIYGTEIYGGTFTIENNKFISYGVGASVGYIHLSPGVSLAEAMLIVVRDNTLELPNAGATSKAVFLRARNSQRPCSVNINGMHIHMAAVALQGFLAADDQIKATFDSNYLIIDNVYGPSGTPLLVATAKNANVPTRQMRQAGAINVTTTAAATIAAPAQTIRYPFSKLPNVSVAVSSQSGGDQSTVGSMAPIPIAYNVGTGSIRPAMIAPSGSFSSGNTARLHWEASLDDI